MEKIMAQCTNMECRQKHDISDMLPRPMTYRCPTCGGYTSIYVSRKLSPEELAKYGPAKPYEGDQKKKPVQARSNFNPKEENDPMAKYPHITKELLEAEFTAGKSGHQVEKEQNLPKGTISYHMKRFGVKSQFAKKPAAAPKAEGKPKQDREPATKLVAPPTTSVPTEAQKQDNETAARIIKAEVELNQEKDAEIERLRTELANKIGEKNQFQTAVGELEEENDRLAAEQSELKRRIGEYEKQLQQAESDREMLLASIEKATTTPKSLDHDPVNHPSHYTAGGIECIDAIEAAITGLSGGRAYNTGAALKYLWRWHRKNGTEDLRKAVWYIDRMIEEGVAE